ncbi:MAG: hypothetical protein G5Z43_000045 [Caldisphaeraceae archaeon]|nr:hypothetical protein [Caldisphaeraceae archaeon]MEB3692386.1 hypothetical protein [Caldisphaeraceae archaeon]
MSSKPKTITVRLPPWVSEEEARRAIEEVVAKLWGRTSIEEIRVKLGVKRERLLEDIEVGEYNIKELRRHERERLS